MNLIAKLRRERSRRSRRRISDESATLLGRLRDDPALTMSLAGMDPDPWQAELLTSDAPRMLALTTRQGGKSSSVGALTIHTALTKPGSLTLLLSPTLRQSGELFRDKMMRTYNALGRPVKAVRETALTLELANGSRVVSLPENEGGIRGYSSVSLLVLDEASRISDDLYRAVRPMLSIGRGRMVALSTPFGKRGWFFEEWAGNNDWQRFKVTADQCPRIDAEFLEEERRSMGDRWFRQEYFADFTDAIDAVFAVSDIQAAVSAEVQPLFGVTP